jgi:hypothetical protein
MVARARAASAASFRHICRGYEPAGIKAHRVEALCAGSGHRRCLDCFRLYRRDVRARASSDQGASDWATARVLEVAALASAVLRIQVPRFTRWTLRQGHANRLARTFSIPRWVLNRHDAYLTWYVVHEVTHVSMNIHGHGPDFKRAERRVLRRFGMVPRYAVAYPHTMLDLDGRVIFVDSPRLSLTTPIRPVSR